MDYAVAAFSAGVSSEDVGPWCARHRCRFSKGQVLSPGVRLMARHPASWSVHQARRMLTQDTRLYHHPTQTTHTPLIPHHSLPCAPSSLPPSVAANPLLSPPLRPMVVKLNEKDKGKTKDLSGGRLLVE